MRSFGFNADRKRRNTLCFIAWPLSGMRHHARVLSLEEKCLLDRSQTQIFLAVTGL